MTSDGNNKSYFCCHVAYTWCATNHHHDAFRGNAHEERPRLNESVCCVVLNVSHDVLHILLFLYVLFFLFKHIFSALTIQKWNELLLIRASWVRKLDFDSPISAVRALYRNEIQILRQGKSTSLWYPWFSWLWFMKLDTWFEGQCEGISFCVPWFFFFI